MAKSYPNLREIIETTVISRSFLYWHRAGAVDAALQAAEAVKNQGPEAIIDAIERVITANEFICRLDDPCDDWYHFQKCQAA